MAPEAMKVPELKEELARLGKDTTGLRDVLRQRLREARCEAGTVQSEGGGGAEAHTEGGAATVQPGGGGLKQEETGAVAGPPRKRKKTGYQVFLGDSRVAEAVATLIGEDIQDRAEILKQKQRLWGCMNPQASVALSL